MRFPVINIGLTGGFATIFNFLVALLCCAVGLWLLAWMMYWAQVWTEAVIPWPG